MKKRTLLTVTALTFVCLSGQPLTTYAASCTQTSQSGSMNQVQSYKRGNKVIFSYGNSCNIQNIFDKLENGCQGSTKPETGNPGTSNPGTSMPEINKPGTSNPGTNVPESDNSGTETPDNSTHAYVQEVVDLVNAERAKEGLSPLTLDTKVQAAAQVRAKECEQSFSHTRPDGTSFSTALKEQNVSYRSAGENIAWGQKSPQEVMNGWMNSSGHRANIMNPDYTTIGVGYYQNANGTNYWCQLFTK